MKRVLAILLAAILLIGLVACSAPAEKPAQTAEPSAASTDIKTIGLCMPTKEQTIWTMQGRLLQESLEKAGYEVLIEYAEDD